MSPNGRKKNPFLKKVFLVPVFDASNKTNSSHFFDTACHVPRYTVTRGPLYFKSIFFVLFLAFLYATPHVNKKYPP